MEKKKKKGVAQTSIQIKSTGVAPSKHKRVKSQLLLNAQTGKKDEDGSDFLVSRLIQWGDEKSRK